jgi:hypothetical protein
MAKCDLQQYSAYLLLEKLAIISIQSNLHQEFKMRHQYHPESFSSRDDIGRGLIRDVIRKEPYHIMFIIYLKMRKSCSVLWTFSHMINIILRGMIKGWWYWYQSWQTNTVVMFFQYYICKFPLFSTKYMINTVYYGNFFTGRGPPDHC